MLSQFSISLRLLAVSIILMCIHPPATAATPVVHISARPVWLKSYQLYNQKVPLRQVQNGFFYQLNEEQIQVEKQADYRHNIREIVSEAGIQNGSEITVSFDPSYEQLDFHQIIVWRNNKPQNRLSSSTFKVVADEQELSKFIYQGSYTAVCILTDIRKGDRVEYAYTITGRNPIFSQHFIKDFYFQVSQPVAHIYKSIQVAPSHQLYFKAFNQVPKTVNSIYNGYNCYEWQVFQAKPAETYDNQPDWYDTYNNLQISDYKSWKEVVDWGLAINPLPTTLSGPLAKRVEQLKAAAGNNKEKYFRAAVQLVQDEVRYMGIEMGQYSHHAHRPELVYSQRYGDCKDKALLLTSMLNASGIEAHLMLVNSSDSRIDRFLPSPGVFDHAVVAAKLNGKPVYIDATIDYQRGSGTNLFFPAYSKGLILQSGNNSLIKLPLTAAGQTTCQEVFTVPAEKGKTQLDVKTTYTLSEADRMRDKIASSSINDIEKGYLNYYTKIYPKVELADTMTVHDDETKNELIITEHYLITNFLKKDAEEGNYTASFYADLVNNQLISVPPAVKSPIAVNFPAIVNYSAKVIIPGGWDVKDSQQSINRNNYEFSSSTESIQDTLLLNYHFKYLHDYIPANELDQYREDVKQLSNSDLSYSITYTPDLKSAPFKPNYWMLLCAGLLAGILSYLGYRIYRTETPGVIFARGATFTPIGGWLILVGISLAVGCILNLYYLYENRYFDLHKWSFYANTAIHTDYLPMLCIEAAGHLCLLCAEIFCFILFIRRRDILPQYIIGLYIAAAAFSIITYVYCAPIHDSADSRATDAAVFRSIISAIVWISYFRRSTRVEETFIVPYPVDNYVYEDHQHKAEALSKK